VRDRTTTTSDHILHDFEGATFEAKLDPLVSRDNVLITVGRASYGTFAHARGMLQIPVIASKGEHVYEGFHLQNVNAYMSRLKAWMAPFKGVASKYLDSYLGWRRMIERDGHRLTPRHAIAEAIGT
jgi:hypothetical protein